MKWWTVYDWSDGKTVRLVATSGFTPKNCIGPSVSAGPDAPTPPDTSQGIKIVNLGSNTLVDPTTKQA